MLKVSKVVQYGTGESTEPKVAFKLPVDLLSRLSQRPSAIYEYELIYWKGGIRIGIIVFGKVENTIVPLGLVQGVYESSREKLWEDSRKNRASGDIRLTNS